MADLTVREFVDIVHRSRLIPKDRLLATLSECKQDGSLPQDAEVIGRFLRQQGLLTEWQEKNLLLGKTKGYFLGDYRVLDHLGKGGMSSVFLARHKLIDRKVAIKVLPESLSETGSYLQRFEQEARATSRLSHPNVVRVFDIDRDGAKHFMVMEYVAGRDLKAVITQDGPLSLELAAYYVAQAAMGLQHAHERGLVHRDIKPANLLVNDKGVVKILDLGLARVLDDEKTSLTVQNSENMMGTADYLAPEQARNAHSVDSRADIYSLGCTFYYLMAGHAPFKEGSIPERIWKHQNERPLDIRAIRDDCPHAVADVCMKMLAKDPLVRIRPCGVIAKRLFKWLADRDGDWAPVHAGPAHDGGAAELSLELRPAAGMSPATEFGEIENQESLVRARKTRAKKRVKTPIALWAGLGVLMLVLVVLLILVCLRNT